jgi:RNA polymerase sigma-70 factor (ECF subfamily)
MQKQADIQTELQLWEALRQSDQQAFAALYDRYFKLLYNYGRKIGGVNAVLEDAIHDLFVDLWRFREKLSPTTSVRFYLYRSLRRKLLRNESRKAFFTLDDFVIEDVWLTPTPSSEQKLIDEESGHQRIHRLRKLLNDLSPRQYEAMVLRFYDEMDFEEIAAVLNVNEQSARNLVQRGLTQLRQYVKYVLSFLVIAFC